MKKFLRNFLIMITVILCFFANLVLSLAIEPNDIIRLDETEIPNDFMLQVKHECSGHNYFLQADANANGDFIILAHVEKYSAGSKDVFKKKFVDIYKPDGTFSCEIIFTTEMNTAIRMNENLVYIIFYNNLMTFNIISEEIHYYRINGDRIWQNSISEIQQDKEFTYGEWTYKCVKDISLNNVKLIKSNDKQDIVLIEMNGRDFNYWYIVLVFFSIIVIIVIKKDDTIKRRSNRSINKPQPNGAGGNNQGNGTGDGSMS